MTPVPAARVFDPYGLAQQDPASPVSGGIQEPEIRYEDVLAHPEFGKVLRAPGGYEQLQQYAASQGKRLVGGPIQQQGTLGPPTMAPAPQHTMPFGAQQEYADLEEFLDYGEVDFTPGGYVDFSDTMNRHERREAAGGMDEFLRDNSYRFSNEAMNHFRKRMANYGVSEGWDDAEVWYDPGELEYEYSSFSPGVQEDVTKLAHNWRARLTEANGFFASNGPNKFSTADPKEKWKRAYDNRAAIEVYLQSGDPEKVAMAEGLLAWANSHGGDFAFMFNRMGEYYKAQLYAKQLRLAWEGQTSPEHANQLLEIAKGAFPGADPQERRKSAAYHPSKEKLESRQQVALRAIRDMAEATARRSGITYQEVLDLPLTQYEARNFIDDAMLLTNEAMLANKGAYAGQQGALRAREDTLTIEAFKKFSRILENIDMKVIGASDEQDATIKHIMHMLKVAESGDITTAHEAGGRVSIPLYIMELVTRFSKLEGTFIDSGTMHTAATAYVTKGGVFTDFWDYMDWATYQMKHNPGAVFQEPKESYDKSYEDRYDMYKRAIFSEEEFASLHHGKETMAAIGGMYHGAKAMLGEAYNAVRGIRPDYEEGQYPIKPTVVRGINRYNKGLWESVEDAWDAFMGNTEGVYLGQAIMEQLTPNIDPEDTPGKVGAFAVGLAFDITGDPVMALKGGHLTAGVALLRKSKIVSTLDAAGKWTKSANRALADLTLKHISEGKKLSMRALGLRSLHKLNEGLLAANQVRKYLPKLPKLKVATDERPVIAILDASKFKNAREAAEHLGGGKLKAGHLKELEAFEAKQVALVFGSRVEAKAAIEAGLITSESVQHGSLVGKNWRIMGKGKDGHGRMILTSDAPSSGKFAGMIRRERMPDGTWLNPDMLPQYELVRDMFRGSDEFAKWFFNAIKNDSSFMQKGMDVLLKDQKTLDKVHGILVRAGVLVNSADDTARVLSRLSGPLKEIVAFQGSGLTLMPTRLRNYLKGGGKAGAWEAGFQHSRQFRIGPFSTALGTDPVLGALRAMGRAAGPKLTTGLEKLSAIAPEYALSLATLMKFGNQAFSDTMRTVRASGLVGLHAHAAIQIPVESVSSLQAKRFGQAALGEPFGNLPAAATAAREVVELSPVLREALRYHSLSAQSAEGWVKKQFARWAITEKGAQLGKTTAGRKTIYTQLNYMVDGGKTFDEGLQHLAFVQKAKYGKVKFKSPGAGKDVKEIEINLETLQEMSPGTRDSALAEVINHITPADIDAVRKVMDPFRENFKNLRKTLDEMGEIGEVAGILKFEERYAPHIFLGAKAKGPISKVGGTGGWEEVLKSYRGSAQDAKLSGHGLRRTGPPTIFEAEVLGWEPILDLRESFHMRATSFISDIHQARLLTVFAGETGFTPITGVLKANELIRSHGQVRSLQDVGDMLAAQSEDFLARSAELRALKKQVDQANAGIKSATKEMGLTKEEVSKLMNADTFEDIVELLATKYSGNMSGPRAEFLLRGQGHVKVDGLFQRLVTEGGLTDDGADLMREIFSSIDTGVLQEFTYYASLSDYNAAAKRLGKQERPYSQYRNTLGFYAPGEKTLVMVTENYALNKASTHREIISTLIHEFGHLAHYAVLSVDELAEVEIIGRRMAEAARKGAPTGRGRSAEGHGFGTEKWERLGIEPAAYGEKAIPEIREYFKEGVSKDLGATNIEYYVGATSSDAPYEWFAQGMVEHILGGHSQIAKSFPKLEQIYDRLGTVIGKSLERLGKRKQPALYDAMRPYMDRFVTGEQTSWRGFLSDLSTVTKEDLPAFVETRLAHMRDMKASKGGHLSYKARGGAGFEHPSAGAVLKYDILRGIPASLKVEAKALIDDIIKGENKSPSSFWDEPLGEHTVGYYIEDAHPGLVESALKRDKTQVRQAVAEQYPELAKKHGYVVDKPGAALARIEAEAVRDSIAEVDKRLQAINKIAADIGKEIDLSAETTLTLLAEMPKGSTEYLMRQMANMDRGLRAAGKRAREAKGAKKESEIVKVKEFKKRKSEYVEHLAKMQELKKQMQGWRLSREEQSMVTMALYHVPSIDYLTYHQATKLLAEGKVSIASLMKAGEGVEFFKDTLSAEKAFRADRTYGRYFVPAAQRERSLVAEEVGMGAWVVKDKGTGKTVESFTNKVAAKKFIQEHLDVPTWMRSMEDVWIPIESALVLQKVGLDYGLGVVEKGVRMGLMEGMIYFMKKMHLVTMTPTTITKTFLTGKALSHHFGRRNQIDAIQKIVQHSGNAILSPELLAEYLAFMRRELGTIEQATGGVVDVAAAHREMEMMLFTTYEQRLAVKKLIEDSPTVEMLAKMTREERMSYLSATPGEAVGKSIERTATVMTGKGVMGTPIQKSTIAGVGIAAGVPEAGLLVSVDAVRGGAGTTAGRLPTLQEVLFPWGGPATEAHDNALRSFIYFMELKAGAGTRQAMENSLNLARNYNNLTDFEKYVVSQVPVMFYNFAKQNVKSVLEVLGTHPGRIALWPKVIANASESIPDEMKESWANALDSITTKGGTWFLPLDLGGLQILDPLATIIAGGAREFAGQEGALSRSLGEAGRLMLPQATPWAHTAFSGLGSDETELGSNKFSRATEQKLVELLGGPGEGGIHNVLNLYYDEDGIPRAEVKDNNYGKVFKLLSVYLPIAQMGNNISRPKVLAEMGETTRKYFDVLGIAKFYPLDIKKDMMKGEEIIDIEGQRLADAFSALEMKNGYLELLQLEGMEGPALKVFEIVVEDYNTMVDWLRAFRRNLGITEDSPRTIKVKEK